MATNTDEIAPDASLDSVNQGVVVGRHRMIGVIAGSVLVAGLALFGVIFYLRRRMSRKSLRRVVDTTRAMPNVSPHSGPPRVKEQREGGIIMRDWNPFIDPNIEATRNPALPVTAVQKQCSHMDRDSQISTTSSGSKSIRFVAPGSYHSPTNSRSSRVAISVTPTDATRTLASNPFTPPRSPVSFKTPADHSATWRGTNLSNIINAARGVRHDDSRESSGDAARQRSRSLGYPAKGRFIISRGGGSTSVFKTATRPGPSGRGNGDKLCV